MWPDPRGSIAQLAVYTAGLSRQGLALPNGFAKQTLTSASVHGSARSRPIHCAHLASPWCERGVSSTVRSRETVLLEHSTNSSAAAVLRQCSAAAVQCSAVQCSAPIDHQSYVSANAAQRAQPRSIGRLLTVASALKAVDHGLGRRPLWERLWNRQSTPCHHDRPQRGMHHAQRAE